MRQQTEEDELSCLRLRLLVIIRLKKIKIADLSIMSGVSRQSLYSYLSRRQAAVPSLIFARDLAKALNVSLDYLVFGEGFPKCESIVNRIKEFCHDDLRSYFGMIDFILSGDKTHHEKKEKKKLRN